MKSGVDPDHIPEPLIEVVVAATAKWIQQTEAGLDFVSRLLHLRYDKGEDNKDYEVIHDDTLAVEQVKPQDIFFISGCIANGRPVPYDSVNINQIESSQCDDCGISSHCTQDVVDPFTDRSKELCNFCITHHEHPRIHELGGRSVCEICTVKSCKHHPDREIKTVGPEDRPLPWRNEYDYGENIGQLDPALLGQVYPPENEGYPWPP